MEDEPKRPVKEILIFDDLAKPITPEQRKLAEYWYKRLQELLKGDDSG